jgi:hypothetical protein
MPRNTDGRPKPPPPLVGARGQYLARLGLVEYSEHVDGDGGRLVKSYRPTVRGLRYCAQSRDGELRRLAEEALRSAGGGK